MVAYKIYSELPKDALKDGSVSPDTQLPMLPLDVQDGFYHLSVKAQVAGTLNRFFSNVDTVYIAHVNIPDDRSIEVPEGQLGNTAEAKLKWDQVTLKPTGEVTYFPHIYGIIRNKDVIKLETLVKTSEGTWEF